MLFSKSSERQPSHGILHRRRGVFLRTRPRRKKSRAFASEVGELGKVPADAERVYDLRAFVSEDFHLPLQGSAKKQPDRQPDSVTLAGCLLERCALGCASFSDSPDCMRFLVEFFAVSFRSLKMSLSTRFNKGIDERSALIEKIRLFFTIVRILVRNPLHLRQIPYGS